MTIRILIIADGGFQGRSLADCSSRLFKFEIVGMTSELQTALQLTRQQIPDVVILDSVLPEFKSVVSTKRILAQNAGTRLIVLSDDSGNRDVIKSLAAGALGYLPRSPRDGELQDAIETVMSNRVYISPSLSGNGVHKSVARPPERMANPAQELSSREQEVLKLLADGRTTRLIAHELFISENTVETHRKNITAKLKLHGIAELTKYALANQITFIDT
jgi:DNA-binding NarL/FixJ family response regulator